MKGLKMEHGYSSDEQAALKQTFIERRSAHVDKLADKWKSTGLLKDIESRYQRAATAVLLENQRLVNEAIEEDDSRTEMFKRISIPIVRRAFGESDFLPWHIISVQPLLKPTGMFFYQDKYNNVKGGEIAAKTRALSCYVPIVEADNGENSDLVPWPDWDGYFVEQHLFDQIFGGKWSQNAIDNTAAMTAVLSKSFQNEMASEIISDLVKHCKSKVDHQWKNKDHFMGAISVLNGIVNRASSKDANWIVMSETLAKELTLEDSLFVNKYKVYVSPLIDEFKILMGYKGDSYLNSGYLFCPYTPLFEVKGVQVRPGVTRRGLSIRYGKKLIYPEQYATMDIKNFQPSEEESDNEQD